jgi:hypothetical protein
MSFVTTAPEFVTAAAGDLARIGSTLGAAHAVAATPTTSIVAAAGDEISAGVATMFGSYGQHYQALSAQAAAFHNEFVSLLNGGAAAYIGTEIANAQQTLQSAMGGPAATAANFAANNTLLGGLLGGGATTSSLGGSQSLLGPINLGNLTSGLNPTSGPTLPGLTLPTLPTLPSLTLPTLPSLTLPTLPGLPSVTLPNLQSLLTGLFGQPSTGPSVQPSTGAFPNPYQVLIQDTLTNLSLLNAAWAAHPFPILTQIMVNQSHYAQVLAGQIAFDLQGFPANVPANIQIALQGASTFNPAAIGQTFVNGANSYWGPAIAGLQKFPMDFQSTLPVVRQDIANMNQAIAAGNYHAAVEDAAHAVLDSFISGFDLSHLTVTVGSLALLPAGALAILFGGPVLALPIQIAGPIGLLGPAADLLPLVSGIGQQAQGLASLVPAGSIAGQEARNFANGISALTNTNTTANFTATLALDPLTMSPVGLTIAGSATFGLPLQLGFALLGPPFAAADGLATGATQFGTAWQAGDALGVLNAIGDTPAYVLNGMLNGQVLVDVTLPASVSVPVAPGVSVPFTLDATAHLPFDGLLVPPQPLTATLPPITEAGVQLAPEQTIAFGGTEFSGLLPFLINTMPDQVASAIAWQNTA